MSHEMFAPPPAARRRGLLVAGVVVAAALAIGAATAGILVARGDAQAGPATSPTASPRTAVFNIYGDVTLSLSKFEWSSETNTCWGRGGFDDIHAGTQVVVYDADGATVAVGALAAGKPLGASGSGRASSCQFNWDINGVPEGSSFYSIEVSHRGKLQYARADLSRRMAMGFS